MKKNSVAKIADYYVPLLLCLGNFIWKYCFIEQRDISMDEPFTVFLSQKNVADIWNMSLNGEPNPPLFTILLHYWTQLFGIEAKVVRIIPLLFNSLTIIFLYKTSQKISGNIAAVLTSCLFLFSNIHFYFALETRTYSLISLCAAAVIYFYINLQHDPKNKAHFAALLFTNLIMVYCHYFSWFVLCNEVLFAAVFFRNKQLFKTICLNISLVFIAYLPIVLAVIKQFSKSSKGTWVNPPYEGQLLNELYFWLKGEYLFVTLIMICIISIASALVMIRLRKYKPSSEQISMLLFCLWWFIVPFFAMYFISFSIPMFLNRYILFNSIAFYLFIGVFVDVAFCYSFVLRLLATAFISIAALKNVTVLDKEFCYREVQKSVKMVVTAKSLRSIVFIHQAWSDLEFVYYYNRSYFVDYKNTVHYLNQDRIFPVWNVEMCRQIIHSENPDKIILYEDGVNGTPESVNIHQYLDSTFLKNDSTFFPQTIFINSYKNRRLQGPIVTALRSRLQVYPCNLIKTYREGLFKNKNVTTLLAELNKIIYPSGKRHLSFPSPGKN